MLTNEDAIEKLTCQVEQIEGLVEHSPCSTEFNKWARDTEDLIEDIFEKGTGYLEDFKAIYFSPLFLSCNTDDATFKNAYLGGLEEAKSLLTFLIEEIE